MFLNYAINSNRRTIFKLERIKSQHPIKTNIHKCTPQKKKKTSKQSESNTRLKFSQLASQFDEI